MKIFFKSNSALKNEAIRLLKIFSIFRIMVRKTTKINLIERGIQTFESHFDKHVGKDRNKKISKKDDNWKGKIEKDEAKIELHEDDV